MSASIAAAAPLGIWAWVRRLAPIAALLGITLALGAVGQSAARPLFIVGCVAVSWDLLRLGARPHFAGCFVLFCLAPFLRRFVDVYAGYEASGLMISGPLFAILVPAPRVLTSLTGGRSLDPELRSFLLCCGIAFWGVILTLISGELTQAASGAVKWLAPPIYGIWLYGEARRQDGLVDTAAMVSLWLCPVLGAYGCLQYVDPPLWDRFWMTYTVIASIGQPEPFMVRVFSTMNAPAGYATFTAAGLLLFGFRKRPWAVLLAATPAMFGLMLSMYRTAWIGLFAGVVMGLFHRQTWRRAAVILLAVPLVGAAALTFTPAGDALAERFQSFTSIGNDASGQERLSEYSDLLEADNGTLLGHGFGTVDVLQAGSRALDGQFVVTWYSFGLVFAIIGLVAVLWAAVQGIRFAWRTGTTSGMAIASVLVSLLFQIPLAVISSSETGFLFWSFAGLGAASRYASQRRR